jgi:plastocyanin
MTSRTTIPRKLRAGLLALGMTVAVGACQSGDSDGERSAPAAPASADTTSVQIKLFRFQPDRLEVPKGATVTWRNDDAILHTVTAGVPGQPMGDFDKELAEKGTSASVTFDSPGTFKYFCSRHPEAMQGEVTVRQ